MALQMSVTASTGYTAMDAYIKVASYICGIDNTIQARLCAYVSKDLANRGASIIEGSEDIIRFKSDYNDGAVNTKKQIYEYAKTLDKYANAIDV